MRELSFVGLSADGRRLLLVAPDSSEYSLRVDDRLATALRRESDRLRGQPADLGPMPANPSPREIQDRVRAGMSVGAIAAAAGVSESAISRFATAVLAERAYIAEQAGQSLIRFREANVPLEQAVRERLSTADIDVKELRWDAWRRNDGDWTVICAFPFNQGERVATFAYDPVARRALPDDDDARWTVEAPGAPSARGDSPIPADDPASQRHDDATPLPRPSVLPTGRRNDTGSGPANPGKSWDSSHPAARAQQRRAQAEARSATGGSDSRVAPAKPTQSETQPRRGGWEDLLLGSAGDYGDEGSERS